MKPLVTRIGVATLSLFAAESIFAQDTFFYQAPTGSGGTWNVYQVFSTGQTFKDANNSANATFDPVTGTTPGRLISINGALENTVAWNMEGRGDAWIGLTDREGAAPGAFESQSTASPSTLGWAWTSGEPFNYQNWGGGEPNDSSGEDAAHIRGDGMWNDNKSGYGVDDPIVPTIVPGSSLNEAAAPLFRSVREYNLQRPAPVANIRTAAFLSFPGSLPGPSGTESGWGIREIRALPGAGNIVDAYNKAALGTGTITEGSLPILDVTDPQTNANGGPILSTAPFPYLTNTAADDNAIITVAKGKVRVPTTGTYTVQVRSDDGFALRVVGQTFTSVNGPGGLDPLDPSTIFFYGGTGDSNTRGVITLTAGDYDVEFLNWEGGGGAFYEVTTGSGASPTTWLPMGAGGSTPFITNVVRMPAPANVKTVAEGGGLTANNITQARALLDSAPGNTSTTETVRVGDGQPSPFPAGTPADEFATSITGSFALNDGDGTPNEPFTITFGILSDDGTQLRIIGQDFDLATDFTGDGTASLVDVNGDMSLTADYFTGNTNAFGRISLTEGTTYNFEAIHFEGGGGADVEVWYAVGDKTATGFDSTFAPLSTSAGTEANQGWLLVPEPSSALLSLIAGAGVLGARRRRN